MKRGTILKTQKRVWIVPFLLMFSLIQADRQCHCKHRCRKQKLHAKTLQVCAKVKWCVCKAGKQIIGFDIPVGGQETSDRKHLIGQHTLWNKDATEKCDGKSENVSKHVKNIIVWREQAD